MNAMEADDLLLPLSGLQHFVFCRRQWALIHLEQQWQENLLTVEGALLHQRAHDATLRERRGDTLVVRSLAVVSHTLGLSGQCDVVVFQQADEGIPLHGETGRWRVFPVEYKRGRPKEHQADEVQLCAQAMCLEEMLCCEVAEGALYLRGTPAAHPSHLLSGAAGIGPSMRRGNAPACPAASHPQSAAHQSLPQLFPERPLPAAAGPPRLCLCVLGQSHGGSVMKHLLNTLFVTTEDIYLSLDGENVVANQDRKELARYPLHTLEGIVSFSYSGASPALMGACAERNVSLAFCTPRGRFLARTTGKSTGNVLLRRTQYRVADDPGPACRIARNMVFGKVYNARWSIERTRRDHSLRVDAAQLSEASAHLKGLLPQIAEETSLDSLRGLEGAGATVYFGVFDQMILGEKPLFSFQTRSRRPPMDPVNAVLSFLYSILANDCASALESVGLDAYVGFLHRDRPGRTSLALDLMEELRPCLADRFVLTLINHRTLTKQSFDIRENGVVLLSDNGRRTVLKHWQERKRGIITHPYLQEKIPWGLVPYVQALLLARYLREDLDAYPPFLWK